VRKAYTKLQSFHVLLGEDSKIFTEEEDVFHYDQQVIPEDEESPLEKYVYELKQYREANPVRYRQIEQTAEGWEIAAATSGTAFFLLKAPRSAQLAISVTQGEGYKTQVLSLADSLEATRTAAETPRVPLPDQWKELCSEAERAYNQYFIRINKSRAGDKRTQALEVIRELYNQPNISAESKRLLEKARRLADRGSFDIIKKMLRIKVMIDEREMMLFQLTQEEIDEVLVQEIGKLVANVESRQGTPMILLGTIK
jgi:hypothetical protein